jgi:hypothetical protein
VVTDDFLTFQHDITTVPIEKNPITSVIHMGVRYPDRYIFVNPGVGEGGVLSFEPMNISINISGSVVNVTSNRIVYKTEGETVHPELVYEYGLIIQDYTTAQISENDQTIIANNSISIPVFLAQANYIASLDSELLTILPADNNYIEISKVNMILDTKYPELWQKKLAGISGVSVNISQKKIYINRSINCLNYPNTASSIGYYSGMITDKHEDVVFPFTNIDKNKKGYPSIGLVKIVGSSPYVLTAEVKNATIDSIHADLTDVTMENDIWNFSRKPDSYVGGIATWTIVGAVPTNKDVITIKLWATNNSMQFYTERAFQKTGSNWN